MRTMILGCGVLAASITSPAAADFYGWAANVSQAGDYGIMDVYAMFDDGSTSNDLFGVRYLDLDPIGFSLFHHDNLLEPAWAPQFSYSADWIDSYLTIGYHAVPFSNPTTPVRDFANWFGPDAVLPPYTSPGPREFPGWRNLHALSDPILPVEVSPNLNDTGGNWGVFVGRFVILNPADGGRRAISFDAGAIWNGGWRITHDVETFVYIPTPGALTLFGVAGLVRRRRRA